MFARFSLAWCVIFGVVAYDSFLAVRHIDVMRETEQNPVGSLIIGTGGVPLLVALKTAGVAAAMLFTFMLWQVERLRKVVLWSCYSIAVFQLGLLAYLETDIVRIHYHYDWVAFHSSRPAAATAVPPAARAAEPAASPIRTPEQTPAHAQFTFWSDARRSDAACDADTAGSKADPCIFAEILFGWPLSAACQSPPATVSTM